MSKNYAIIIQFVLPLTTFNRPQVQRRDVYKRDAIVTSWRFHNRAWQPRRHDRLPETSGTLWIHRGALTNQRCSLATGCGIMCNIDGNKIPANQASNSIMKTELSISPTTPPVLAIENPGDEYAMNGVMIDSGNSILYPNQSNSLFSIGPTE